MQIGRLRVDLARRGDLLRDAVLHHDDAVGERERLVLVMRDVDRGPPELGVDAPDFGTGFDPQLRVEIGQRLVHQDERRLDDDRPRDGDALLLTAGELTGQLVLLARELHHLERLGYASSDFAGRDAAHAQAEADVLLDRHVRKQRVVLEHHAEAALLGRQRVDPGVVEHDRPAGKRQQAGDAVERGGLAAAGWAEERDELAALDRHRQLGQRVERGAAGAGEATSHRVELEFVEIGIHGSRGFA